MDATTDPSQRHVVIIGAGPAGLTAAREIARRGLRPILVEKGAMVGGLARTESYKGFHFDMGGHRFFTKVAEVNKIWHEVLGDEFLRRPRLSRIYYNRQFFHYPLRPLNALLGLGAEAGRAHRSELPALADLPSSRRRTPSSSG